MHWPPLHKLFDLLHSSMSAWGCLEVLRPSGRGFGGVLGGFWGGFGRVLGGFWGGFGGVLEGFWGGGFGGSLRGFWGGLKEYSDRFQGHMGVFKSFKWVF